MSRPGLTRESGSTNLGYLQEVKSILNDMDKVEGKRADLPQPRYDQFVRQLSQQMDLSEFSCDFGDFAEHDEKQQPSNRGRLDRLLSRLTKDAETTSKGDDSVSETRRRTENNGFCWKSAKVISCDGWDDEATLAASLAATAANTTISGNDDFFTDDDDDDDCWEVEEQKEEKKKHKKKKKKSSSKKDLTPEEAEARRRRKEERRRLKEQQKAAFKPKKKSEAALCA